MTLGEGVCGYCELYCMVGCDVMGLWCCVVYDN